MLWCSGQIPTEARCNALVFLTLCAAGPNSEAQHKLHNGPWHLHQGLLQYKCTGWHNLGTKLIPSSLRLTLSSCELE